MTVARLTELTAEQEALIPIVRDEWLRHGYSCEPADRPMAEAGVRAAYEAAGLSPPRVIVWVDSPMAGALAYAMWPLWIGAQIDGQIDGQIDAQIRAQIDAQIRGQIHGQIDAQIDGQIDAQTHGQIDAQIRAQIDGQIDGQIRAQIHGQIRAQIDAQIRGQIRGQIHGQIRAQIDGQIDGQIHGQIDGQIDAQIRARGHAWWRRLGGNLWASWYGYVDFYRRIGIPGLERIEGAAQVARSAGWWFPMRDSCIIVERPVGRIYSQQIAPAGWGSHVLHREDGPAIAWRDGTALWCWHGTRVPQWVIEHPTPERIQAESNTEIRRCAIESYGWDRYLAELGVSPVDDAEDPGNPGHRLRLYDLPDSAQLYGERVRLVVMDNASRDRDGTRRTYAETVPASCKTALDAVAWQFDVPTETYRTLVRAT